MATRTRVSLEKFLAMPETEPPSELWDGEVVQKVAPNFMHGFISTYLSGELRNYLLESGEGVVVTEVRHVHRSEERVYLPDINVVLTAHIPPAGEGRRQGPLEITPDFAIEILSPGDQAGRTLQRADSYMRAGVPLTWFVDPETKSITVYRPGLQPQVHKAPARIDAQPVLKAFMLELADLFDVPGDD